MSAPDDATPREAPVKDAPLAVTEALADPGPPGEPPVGPPAGPAAEPAAEPATKRRTATTVAAGLLLLVVLVAVGLAVLLVHDRGDRDRRQAVDAARTQALATARKAAPLLLSYDYRTLDKDFKAALSYTDGEFKKQYQQTTSSVVSPVAVRYKAVVRAELIELGASSATDDKVVVIAFLNQVTTSTRVTGTKLDQSRVRMVLQRSGSDWKVVSVQAL